jgi:hypothetical protein
MYTVIGEGYRFECIHGTLYKIRPKFLSFKASVPSLGLTKPPIQMVPGLKRIKREADRSATSSAEAKNE